MMMVTKNATAIGGQIEYDPLVFMIYLKSLLLHAKSRYKEAEFVGCSLALTMFVFMFYVLFEVLAYFFLGWFGKYRDERSSRVEIYLLGTCSGYWLGQSQENWGVRP